jgi:hypothetical protein
MQALRLIIYASDSKTVPQNPLGPTEPGSREGRMKSEQHNFRPDTLFAEHLGCFIS